ncbi:CREB-binding protein-like [Planococcus citri]|uniref:CREB-binding protein-like n=1 Tax=Planococcus citri TaxID=170843 RepID=UPI0031F7DAD2
MLFDLENDLPDEIMASTSQSTSVTRNNYRVVPAADGNSLRLRIRAEPKPMSSTPRSTSIDQSLPTSSSSSNLFPQLATNSSTPPILPTQPTASASSDLFSQPVTNSPTPMVISAQSAASSTSNYLTQSQTVQSLNPVTLSQTAIVQPSFLQSQTSSSTYSTSSSQPMGMSSTLFQPQTNQYVYPASSSQSATVTSSSFLPQSQNNHPGFATTSSQSTGMSSTSFLPQSQNNLPVYASRSAAFSSTSFLPQSQNSQTAYSNPISPFLSTPPLSMWSPCINPSASRNTNQSSYMFPSSVSTAPRYYPSVNIVPPSTTQTNPQSFPVTGGSSQQPSPIDRKVVDMKRKWYNDQAFDLRHQTTSSAASGQSTGLSSAVQSTARHLQAVAANLRVKMDTDISKNTSAQETTTPAADNVTPSNKTMETNAQQNAKEWHNQINVELREQLVEKLVQTLFPSNGAVPIPLDMTQNLKTYIGRVEREIFESSNSKDEYYQILSEKSDKIQKFYNKKRLERQGRKEQQPQQQQQLQQDVEMSQSQSTVETSKNNSVNQSSITTSGASHILSLVNNVSINKPKKTVTKDWHKQIGTELREILVKEFVQKMLPVPGSEEMMNDSEEPKSSIDDRIKSYAKNVECDIYQKADSRIEYYDLLADKYCKMHEELRKGNFAALDNS